MPGDAIWLIYHGKLQDDPRLQIAREALRSAFGKVTERGTRNSGDGRTLASEAAQAGAQRVIAAGGDGLLNEVAQGLLSVPAEQAPSLGVLPTGTANDFATSLHISNDPAQAVRLVFEEPATPIDIGFVNDQCFLNMATGGIGAIITQQASPRLKQMLGAAAYTLSGLRHLTSIEPIEASFDSHPFQWEGGFLAMAVGNGRRSGGGHLLCPGALLDDGLLDVMILPRPAETDTRTLLEALFTQGLDGLPDAALSAQVRELRVQALDPVPLNRDGEPMNERSLHFRIEPTRLRLHLPADAPMLQRSPAEDSDR